MRGVVEHAEIAYDLPERFVREVLVGAADRLEQGVILQRFIEVQRLEDGCIETGEQLGRDDQKLQRRLGVVELLDSFFPALVFINAPFLFELEGVVGLNRK